MEDLEFGEEADSKGRLEAQDVAERAVVLEHVKHPRRFKEDFSFGQAALFGDFAVFPKGGDKVFLAFGVVEVKNTECVIRAGDTELCEFLI